MRVRGSTPAPSSEVSGSAPTGATAADQGRASPIAPPSSVGSKAPKSTLLSKLEPEVAAASSMRRGPGPEGRRSVLTRWQRGRVLEMLESPPDGIGPRLEAVIDALPGEAHAEARALILKAVAARIELFEQNPNAFKVIEDLAELIKDEDGAALLARATVLDLDSTTSANSKDPLAVYARRGVIYAPSAADEQKDNDGLFQRWTASCGPTVIQMMLAENDPLLSFAIHKWGVHSDATDDPTARFQKRVLEQYGGRAIGRVEAQLRARMRNALGRLAGAGQVSKAGCRQLRDYVDGETDALTPAATAALQQSRARFKGFPKAAELSRLRKASPLQKSDSGWWGHTFVEALNRLITPVTGVVYEEASPGGFARGQAWRHLDRATAVLARGIAVPFGIQEPGHYLLLTDVKGKKPNRAFLVSDPDGGRTAWVKEKAFRKGTFVDEQFHLCEGEERGYVDSFFFPLGV